MNKKEEKRFERLWPVLTDSSVLNTKIKIKTKDSKEIIGRVGEETGRFLLDSDYPHGYFREKDRSEDQIEIVINDTHSVWVLLTGKHSHSRSAYLTNTLLCYKILCRPRRWENEQRIQSGTFGC